MEKEVKLNLDPPDLSKAKLTLEEEGNSVEMDPKLKLNSEPIGLAQKLVLDLEKAYENPAIKAYIKAEEDRRALIQASIERWNEPSLQTKMREYEELLKSPAYAMALEVPTSIRDYAAQMANSFDSKNYEEAKKMLEGFHPQMNTAYSVAQSALEQMQKTIDSPSIQSYLSQLPNLEIYESGLAKAAASIANNADMIKAAQSLNEIGKSIVNDSFQQRISKHATANLHVPPMKPIEIPKNHLFEHTKQIVDQNDQLIEATKLQNDILNDMAEYMRLQNSYTDQSVKQLERQNEQIEDQLIELKKQNKIASSQISDNRKSARNTMVVAIFSILLSAYTSYMSYQASYEIYHLEKNDNDSDNEKLLKTIKDKQIEIQKQDQLIKLIEEENKYLKKLAEREPK